MMNRVFHVKITGMACMCLVVCTALAVAAFWFRFAIGGTVMALALIVNIERSIHSTYTLTSQGELVMYYGRFRKPKTLLLATVTGVELKRRSGWKGWLTPERVLVHRGAERRLALVPDRPEEFVAALEKAAPHLGETKDRLIL